MSTHIRVKQTQMLFLFTYLNLFCKSCSVVQDCDCRDLDKDSMVPLNFSYLAISFKSNSPVLRLKIKH